MPPFKIPNRGRAVQQRGPQARSAWIGCKAESSAEACPGFASAVQTPAVARDLNLPETEGDKLVSRLLAAGADLAAAPARGDDHVLLAVNRVRAGRRVPASGKLVFEQNLAGTGVERAELLVLRGAEEEQAALGDDRTADIERTGPLDAAGVEFGVLTDRPPPAVVAGGQVQTQQFAPRGLGSGVAVLVHEERIARMHLGVADAFGSVEQREILGPVVRVDEHQAGFRIVARAAPDGSADRPRVVHGALPTRRRVEDAPAQVLEPALDIRSGLGGNVGDLRVVLESLARERRRFGRERLRWVGLFAVDIRGGYGAFLDVPNRFARRAVEDVPESLLRDLHHDVLPSSSGPAPSEHGLRGQVVVPEIVVRRLEMPLAFARADIQGDDAIAEEILAGPVGAVEVVGGRPSGDEQQAAFGVQAHAGPVVGAAGMLPALFAPGFVAELARMGNGVEDPPPFAGADIEAANVPRGGRGRPLAAGAAANEQEVLEDHRRTGVVTAGAFGKFAVEAFFQVEDAAIAELRHELPRIRIEAVQPVLGGPGHEDAAVPAVAPIGHAAIDAFRTPHPNALEGVEVPQHLAGGGIESANLHLRGGDVHAAVDDDRFAFDLGDGTRKAIAGRMDPGDLEVGDVGAVNLIQFGVPRRAVRAAVARPVARSARRGLGPRRVEGGAGESGVLEEGAAGRQERHGVVRKYIRLGD